MSTALASRSTAREEQRFVLGGFEQKSYDKNLEIGTIKPKIWYDITIYQKRRPINQIRKIIIIIVPTIFKKSSGSFSLVGLELLD